MQVLAWANWLVGRAKGNEAGEVAALGSGDGEENCEFSWGPHEVGVMCLKTPRWRRNHVLCVVRFGFSRAIGAPTFSWPTWEVTCNSCPAPCTGVSLVEPGKSAVLAVGVPEQPSTNNGQKLVDK